MTHAFLLIVYLGTKIVSQDMYFYNIDQCKYFAERLNKQPPVPNNRAGEDEPKFLSYTAVCAPKVVKPNNKIY
jgi:hypothetical protein